ncbi:MAG: hypothetical protein PQ971_03080 [Methanobacterium sp.]
MLRKNQGKFDVVDIDTFGSPSYYVESAAAAFKIIFTQYAALHEILYNSKKKAKITNKSLKIHPTL